MNHKDALKMLQDPQLLKKELKFMSSTEYYRRKQQGSGNSIGGGGGALSRADGKSNFLSVVRRARLETDEKNTRFTQYEIVSNASARCSFSQWQVK